MSIKPLHMPALCKTKDSPNLDRATNERVFAESDTRSQYMPWRRLLSLLWEAQASENTHLPGFLSKGTSTWSTDKQSAA